MATSFPMPESPKKQGQPLITLDTLTTRLQHYSARRLPGRNWVARCGVILLIAEHGISGYRGPLVFSAITGGTQS
jgi:hypothetical protein